MAKPALISCKDPDWAERLKDKVARREAADLIHFRTIDLSQWEQLARKHRMSFQYDPNNRTASLRA